MAQKFQNSYKSADDIPKNEIPASYNLKSLVNDVDLTSEVTQQGGCGSCHATSFISAVQSRLQIKYGRKLDKLSIQFLLQCNYLNEGCDGGWPVLNSYLAEQAYLISDKCAPYWLTTDNHKCSDYAHCAPVARVTETKFMTPLSATEDFASRELAIQKEILFHGPVAANMATPKYFRFYKNGVLVTNQTTEAKIDDKLLELGLITLKDDGDDTPFESKVVYDVSLPEEEISQASSAQVKDANRVAQDKETSKSAEISSP